MGKHSLDDTTVFWRSFSLTVLKWLAIVAVPLAAGLLTYNLVIKPRGDPAPVKDEPSAASPRATGQTPAAVPSAEGKPDVQVLKGSAEASFVDAATSKLTAAGYEVVDTGAASRTYEKTTVFYQSGFEQQAEDLAEFTDATERRPAPDNLDKNIPLTLVTGNDYRSG